MIDRDDRKLTRTLLLTVKRQCHIFFVSYDNVSVKNFFLD
jgi:hypothetical protein